MDSGQKSQADLESAARRWVVRLSGDDHSAADLAAFQAWVSTSPAHRHAYNMAGRVWTGIQQLTDLRGLVHVDDLQRFAIPQDRPRVRERVRSFLGRPLLPIGAAAALVATIWIVATVDLSGLFGGQETEYTTAVAEVHDVVLTDGSTVTLGAASKIKVDFTKTSRNVALVTGDAYFAVTADSGRPFLVTAGDAVVRVVGTKFDVRKGAQRVWVAVAEGVVEVTDNTGQAPSQLAETVRSPVRKAVLTAGQQVVVRAGELGPTRDVSGSAPGAWRDGRLYFDGETLAEVISDANRYYDGQIEIASSDIAAMRVTGAFGTQRIDQMLEGIEQILPVEIDRTGERRIVLRARRSALEGQ